MFEGADAVGKTELISDDGVGCNDPDEVTLSGLSTQEVLWHASHVAGLSAHCEPLGQVGHAGVSVPQPVTQRRRRLLLNVGVSKTWV
jgi:hypothetical protein